MSGDLEHLQRLTDEQVTARIASYGDDGASRRRCASCGDDADRSSRPQCAPIGEDVGCLSARHFTCTVDESWVRSVAERA